MKNLPDVLIIMLNYNGKRNLGPILDRCIQTVLGTDYPNFRLLFVDNKSTDESVSYVRKKYGSNPKLSILSLDKNYGYAGANNRASKHHSKSKYLAFVNNDIVVPKDWLKRIIEQLESKVKEKIIALSPIIYDESVKKFIVGTYIDYPSGRYYIPMIDDARNFPNKTLEVDFPAGECFVIRRDIFDNIGGFDERYFLYHDDADLGWRLRLKGYRIAMVPQVRITHFRSMTVKKEHELVKQKLFFEGNRLNSCLKNLEFRSIIIALPIIEIGIFMAVSILSVFKRRYRSWLKGYLYALWQVLRSVSFEKRMKIQRERKISDKELFRNYFNRVPLKGYKRLSYLLYKLIT